MEENRYSRTVNLIGAEKLEKIRSTSVLLLGVGGVGGICAEALCRVGVKKLGLVDFDIFKESNLNRQILSTIKDLGRKKVEVAKERCALVNPDVQVDVFDLKIDERTVNDIPFEDYDFVIDAIDDIKAKILAIKKCREAAIKEIVCCGTGNNLFGEGFVIKDIKNSSYCPLAKKLRAELKKVGIYDGITVLFKNAEPFKRTDSANGYAPTSMFFAPNTAGIMLAGKVVEWIINDK